MHDRLQDNEHKTSVIHSARTIYRFIINGAQRLTCGIVNKLILVSDVIGLNENVLRGYYRVWRISVLCMEIFAS